MLRPFSITSFTTACLAAACWAPPALAQGVLKPVDALIVNPVNRPVPVSIVAPAAPATATCRIDIDISGNLLPVPAGGTSTQIASLECPAGVSRLDVHRVVFHTGVFVSAPVLNQVHFNVSVALGRLIGNSAVLDMPIATLSDGTPDLSLARPVRIDKTAAGVYAMTSMTCSSGIAGLAPKCAGTVFLIGTPVN